MALEVLSLIATFEHPTASQIANKLRRDSRIIKNYLEALEAILVIHRLLPHHVGVGKSEYVLCDAGIAGYLGCSRETAIRTHLLTEALAHFESQGLGKPLIFYFRNEKTSRVPIVFEWTAKKKGSAPGMAIQFFDGESPQKREFESLRTFSARLDPGARTRLLLLTQSKHSYTDGKIEVHPLRG